MCSRRYRILSPCSFSSVLLIFLSTGQWPRKGLEKDREVRFCVLVTVKLTHTNAAPMVDAEPATFSPRAAVILVKHVYGAPGGV